MKRILVMDANSEIRERARRRLESEGHTVAECENSALALELFRNGATAVVMAATRDSLSVQFLDEIRRADKGPSVIVLSESIWITVGSANDDVPFFADAGSSEALSRDASDREPPPASSPRLTEGSLNGATLRDYRLPAEGIRFADLERDVLSQALRLTRGNQTRAGVLLGLTRDQIRYRMAKFSLTSAHFEQAAESAA